MPIKRLDHVDLAVRDVERSLAFYLAVLGPLGVGEAFRYPTYRGTGSSSSSTPTACASRWPITRPRRPARARSDRFSS
jgi:catechol 2,3-dioxygenase-like lactoylglutathione lyase family enzyme